MIDLDEEIRDALGETFNIALGEASALFAELVHQEIELTVPKVELLAHSALLGHVTEFDPGGTLCRIGQNFSSNRADIRTEAVLILPERACIHVLRQMLGGTECAERINELEQDALAEVGNIIINSCMNSLAQIFDREMIGTLPDVRTGDAADLLSSPSADNAGVLVASIGMRMAALHLSGSVLFMMDLPSLQVSIAQIRRFFGLTMQTDTTP